MKSIKIITSVFLFLFSFFFSIPLKAQTDTVGIKKICDEYMKIFSYKYIFEGKTISSKYITVKTGERSYYNYTSYLVQVHKVIKGNIQSGTIEILQAAPGITYRGDGYTESMGKAADMDYSVPNEAIYFSNQAVDVKDSGFKNTNSISLLFYDGIPESNGILKKEKWGISRYFSTLSDFYNYISANYGVKIEYK